MFKFLSKIITNSIENFDTPPKHTRTYLIISLITSVLFALTIVLSTLFINSDFFNSTWDRFWENLIAYKEVIVYGFFSILYVVLFIYRANTETFIAAFIIKFITTAYMVNLLTITFTKILFDIEWITDEKWYELLPYKSHYPISAMFILFFVWGITWYSSLVQRKVLKSENPEHEDIYDNIKDWLNKKYA